MTMRAMRCGLRCALVCFATLLCALHVYAQESDYTLGAEDVIEISVRNHADLDKTLTVLPNGKITYAGVGELQVSGRTPRVVAATIEQELRKTYNNLAVTVAVKEIHSRRVRVIGSVKAPGPYDLKANWRVFDVLAAAGGLTARPGRISGRLIRDGVKAVTLALPAIMAAPDSDANMRLKPDDILLLEEQEVTRHQVFVMGQVAKQGAYELDEGLSLLSLLSLAGNPTDRAALSRAYIVRGNERIPLSLHAIITEGKPDPVAANFVFQPGDMLFLPALEARYAVMGRVIKSGYFPFPENGSITVLDAINLAGGLAQDAETRQCGIIRMLDGKPAAPVKVNIDALLRKGDASANLVLQPNDILYVPQRGVRSFNWGDLLAPISALSLLGFRL